MGLAAFFSLSYIFSVGIYLFGEKLNHWKWGQFISLTYRNTSSLCSLDSSWKQKEKPGKQKAVMFDAFVQSRQRKSLGEVHTFSKDPIKLSPRLLQTTPHLALRLKIILCRELRTQRARVSPTPAWKSGLKVSPSLKWGLEVHKLLNAKNSSLKETDPDDPLSSSTVSSAFPDVFPSLSHEVASQPLVKCSPGGVTPCTWDWNSHLGF